jgi:flagellar hook-length control protein FliK
MIEALGSSAAPPTGAAATVAAAPPAGTFLQLLAGGVAAPLQAEALGLDPAADPGDEVLPGEDDPAGFLSAWFGLAPLPPAANEAGASAAVMASGAGPGALPSPRGALPSAPAASTQALEPALLPLPSTETALASGPVTLADPVGLAALAAPPDLLPTSASPEGLALPAPLSEAGASPRGPERAAAPMPMHSLPVDADFEAALDARLRWQIDSGLSEAVIDLNPAELGALTIRIQMHGDQASLQIHAAEAATRQLLQQLLPQMGERLAQSGLFYSGGEVRDRAVLDEEAPASGTGDAAGRPARRPIAIHLVDAYV